MLSLACAACGPGSLWGQPHPASQCVLSRDGFDLWQIALYLKCKGCNNKYGLDCLRKLSEKVYEYERSLSDGEYIHDPQGVWKTLKALPYEPRLRSLPCGPGSLWGQPHPASQCVLNRASQHTQVLGVSVAVRLGCALHAAWMDLSFEGGNTSGSFMF